METFEPKPDNQIELFRAKVENAKKAVEQAQIELDNVLGDDNKTLWSERLKHRQEDLKRIQEKLDEILQEQLEEVAA